jgi:PiT family inorganic phosphate transporter
MLLLGLFLATFFLAYCNGANDNFKGVATLFGSQTTNYKTAIGWATITTFAGSVFSIFLAETLVKSFSGKGLVPDEIANAPDFHLAVAIAAGLTVILATLTGFPISTTHGLTGALVGAGLVAIGTQVNLTALQKSFLMPLLLSPMIAILLAALIYALSRYLRVYLGIQKEWCICAGQIQQIIPIPQPDATNILKCITTADVAVDSLDKCTQRYLGNFLQIPSQKLVDVSHFMSAGIVSFARGLNDTPKIVSLMLVGQSISVQWGSLAVGLGMAIGGLLNAKKVAETMSKKLTAMNTGQGLVANLVTGFLVIAASRYGLPVSTTHVSVGSIFGVGLISKKANVRVFYQILLSWILTLPIAAAISGCAYWVLHR